jgi:hypothetical protein
MMNGVILVAVMLAQGTERVAVDPVACWWRTTATAVRVGEPFDVVLTCSLLEADASRVVADASRLDPAVVQLQPFEVIGGAKADDVIADGRRFVQFEYRIRAVAENVFASEVALPALEIGYRVEARAPDGNTVAGRDLTYAMPPLTIRVLSLVPDTADDIREAPVATFGAISRLESRGRMFRAAAAVSLAAGALLLALAIWRRFRERRAKHVAAPKPLPPAAVLAGVRRDLAAIQSEVRSSGWTDERIGQALAAVRIIAAYATARPVSQQVLVPGARVPAGELHLGPSNRSSSVWSTLTSTDDDELRSILDRLSSARYGRTAELEVDDVMGTMLDRIDRLVASRPLAERLWTRFRL